jgi:hypothetical protein
MDAQRCGDDGSVRDGEMADGCKQRIFVCVQLFPDSGAEGGGELGGSRHSLGLIGLIVWVEPQYYMHSLQPETWQSSDDASDDASES